MLSQHVRPDVECPLHCFCGNNWVSDPASSDGFLLCSNHLDPGESQNSGQRGGRRRWLFASNHHEPGGVFGVLHTHARRDLPAVPGEAAGDRGLQNETEHQPVPPGVHDISQPQLLLRCHLLLLCCKGVLQESTPGKGP